MSLPPPWHASQYLFIYIFMQMTWGHEVSEYINYKAVRLTVLTGRAF